MYTAFKSERYEGSQMMKAPKLKGFLGVEHIPEKEITLSAFLDTIEQGVHVAIGAGSGYMYIGSVRGFYRDVPYIDFHYEYACAKYFYGSYKYNIYVPLLLRRVEKYWSRNLKPDEPPMWCISVEGDENGPEWVLSEVEKVRSRYKEEFAKLMIYNESRATDKDVTEEVIQQLPEEHGIESVFFPIASSRSAGTTGEACAQ